MIGLSWLRFRMLGNGETCSPSVGTWKRSNGECPGCGQYITVVIYRYCDDSVPRVEYVEVREDGTVLANYADSDPPVYVHWTWNDVDWYLPIRIPGEAVS